MRSRVWAFAPLAAPGAVALAFLCLAGCDGAPSAVPARSHADAAGRSLADAAAEADAGRATGRSAAAEGERRVPVAAETPLFHGRPVWAANRDHTAAENADYHWRRDGEALGATSREDFLTKVHAFVDHPPEGVQTLTRANGDRLFYDPKANLFAVADKDGAPRTIFKPRDGAAYWRQQKDGLADADGAPRRRSARRTASDDNG